MADVDPTTPKPTLRLPEAQSISDVNQNFTSLTDYLDRFADESQKNHERTTVYITQIAEEANKNFAELTKDIKTILSSQTMMFNFCVIGLAVLAILLREGYTAAINVYHLFVH